MVQVNHFMNVNQDKKALHQLEWQCNFISKTIYDYLQELRNKPLYETSLGGTRSDQEDAKEQREADRNLFNMMN